MEHPDQTVGMLSLIRAIGTTDGDFYAGVIGQLVKKPHEIKAGAVRRTRGGQIAIERRG